MRGSIEGHRRKTMDGSLAAYAAPVEREGENAQTLGEIRRRLRLIENGMRRLSCSPSGGRILVDREGCVVNADAHAARALAAAGIEVDSKSCSRIETADVPAMQRPEWLRAARIEPVIVGGERLGTLIVLPESLRCGADSRKGALPRYKVRRVV